MRSLKADDGVAVVLFALLSPIFLMCTALAVDVSTFYLEKRALQSATNFAAMAAAQNPQSATLAAQRNLTLNGFNASAVETVEFGQYTADPSVPAAQRFVALATGNAVRVTTQIQVPYYFAAIINLAFQTAPTCSGANCTATLSSPSDSATITATATATFNPSAAFAVGSGLANLNGGVLNAVLNSLLGSNLNFLLMDYQSLANANIDLFAFSNALAARLNLTAVTYNQLASAQAQSKVVFAALADAARATPGVALSVADTLSLLAATAPNSLVTIGQLISFGQYGSMQVGSPEPITIQADALDMVSGIAALANGTHQLQVGLNISAPPIASASVTLDIGEPPIGFGFVAIGSGGASVHTAQTRLLFMFQLIQGGSLPLVNVPIYIELASATAAMSSVGCSLQQPTSSSVTLSVTPAIANTWIGSVSPTDMANFAAEPSPGAAILLTLPGLLVISGRAHAEVDNLQPASVNFTYDDIVNDHRKTTSTNDFTSSLFSNLFGSLQLTASVAGVNVSVPQTLSSSIATTLATASVPIDQTISQVFQALGLGLGNAYTWVSGVKCGTAKIVM